jgi:hypothetical protein
VSYYQESPLKKSISKLNKKQASDVNGEYSFRKMEITADKQDKVSEKHNKSVEEEEKRTSGVTVSNSQPE